MPRAAKVRRDDAKAPDTDDAAGETPADEGAGGGAGDEPSPPPGVAVGATGERAENDEPDEDFDSRKIFRTLAFSGYAEVFAYPTEKRGELDYSVAVRNRSRARPRLRTPQHANRRPPHAASTDCSGRLR